MFKVSLTLLLPAINLGAQNLGFQSLKTAYATIKGFEVMRMFKKSQMHAWYYSKDIMGEERLVERQFGF